MMTVRCKRVRIRKDRIRRDRSTVVSTCFKIVELLSSKGGYWCVSEISRELSIDAYTVRRALYRLVRDGIVKFIVYKLNTGKILYLYYINKEV